MPVMLLPFLPLTTVIMSIFVITSVKFTKFECADLVQDSLDCDDDPNTYYDDSSDLFHAYAKKS